MAEKVVLEAEVKSNIKEVGQDASDLASEFKVMGVSLNDVKAGFRSVGRTAKASFASIKAGLISTGIGAFVVAIGSLVAWFTRTKKGAELLERTFAGLGAAVNVIVDRVAKFGGAIVKLFQGDTKGALQDVKDTFKGIGDEVQREITLTIELKRQVQELRDRERDLNVEMAQRRAEIEQLKMVAEDLTKTESERLDAAEKAFAIENKLLKDRLFNASEAVRLEKERHATIVPMAEDLDKLADLEVELANITEESTTKQIELNNKINSIKQEGANKRKADFEEEKREFEERTKEITKMGTLEVETFDDVVKKKLESQKKYLDKTLDNIETEKAADKTLKDVKVSNQRAVLAASSAFAGALADLAGENKVLASASALVNTYLAVSQVWKDETIPSTAIKAIMAGTVLLNGLNNVRKIMSVNVPGGGGGGGVSGGTSGTPTPEMLSGTFQLGQGEAPEPLRAYVITDEMTNSQDQLANIRRRATI